VKAVNLIPSDSAAAGPRAPRDVQAVIYGTLGALAIGIALMAMYVLAGNKIAQRQVQIASLQQQVSQTQGQLGQLQGYVKFQQLAQTRLQTVEEIASSRFDWAAALGELSRVVPANTTLQTVSASLSAGVSGGTSGLRSALTGPAFELNGCTANQVDVARLMSRLRLMPDVVRVTLTSSQAPQAGATPVATSGGAGTGAGCGNGPTFDMLVFFSGPAGSGAAATGTSAGSTAGAAAPSAAAPTASAPSAAAAPAATPPAAAAPAAAAPAANTPGAAAPAGTATTTTTTSGATR
jgi:Tfp pilus assembly protein PilN